MKELTSLTIAELSAGYDKKEFTPTEVTKAYLDNMSKAKEYNAYITETPDEALKAAASADERVAKGCRLNKLDGIPLAVKDLYCTKNIRTTAASKILENFIPPYESSITQKLLDMGAIFLGKTNAFLRSF